ncbi:hypothetical protein [Levilactobacillus brevis]|uniref:hypothetical protein n=1 Tax=Levilactobacillus brevis TaxID=1580 RepID=UPI001BA5AB71|nr:hypothetical protein [Levilactobacillus brevis]MBS0977456.1 hypothetical protein [Levilactobacillus brevis]
MQNKGISNQNDNQFLEPLVKRIPFVLATFAVVFIVICFSLVQSLGYIPMKQRLLGECIIAVVMFISLTLISIFLYKTIKYIIDTNNSMLLDAK